MSRVTLEQQTDHIRQELSRYCQGSQLARRIEDRLTECAAKGLNPLEWAYLENTETVNFKTATYFRWEKVYANNRRK